MIAVDACQNSQMLVESEVTIQLHKNAQGRPSGLKGRLTRGVMILLLRRLLTWCSALQLSAKAEVSGVVAASLKMQRDAGKEGKLRAWPLYVAMSRDRSQSITVVRVVTHA